MLVARNRLRRSIFRPFTRSARGTVVQSLSDDADALLDCYNEKDLQMQGASARAGGGGRLGPPCGDLREQLSRAEARLLGSSARMSQIRSEDSLHLRRAVQINWRVTT